MRLLVCGGRTFWDRTVVHDVMDAVDKLSRITVVITGGARGADSLAQEWAIIHGRGQVTFIADWERHGRSAGPLRNRLMILEGKPDAVLAFPGGKGTQDMIKRALAAGVPVEMVG